MIQGKTIHMFDGETQKVTSSWVAECEQRGTSVSSSAWTTSAGTLSSAALASNVATVLLAENGGAVLENAATLANGEILVRWFYVTVTE